jgi:hypothetical protein
MNFHPSKSPLSLLYEVVDGEGITVWAGDNPYDAIEEYRSQAVGKRLLVSGWEGNEPEDMPVGQPLDMTELIAAVRGGWVW